MTTQSHKTVCPTCGARVAFGALSADGMRSAFLCSSGHYWEEPK